MTATPRHAANRKPVTPRSAHPPSNGRSPETAGRNLFMPAGPERGRAAFCPSLESCSSKRESCSSGRPISSWFGVESIGAPYPVQCHPHEGDPRIYARSGGHSTGRRLFLRFHAVRTADAFRTWRGEDPIVSHKTTKDHGIAAQSGHWARHRRRPGAHEKTWPAYSINLVGTT